MNDRRIITERRANDLKQDRLFRCSKRAQPDRRLNNIKVEWIATSRLHAYPQMRLVFSRD